MTAPTEEQIGVVDLDAAVRKEVVLRTNIIVALAQVAGDYARRGFLDKASEMLDSLIQASDAREARATIEKGAPLDLDEKVVAWNIRSRS